MGASSSKQKKGKKKDDKKPESKEDEHDVVKRPGAGEVEVDDTTESKDDSYSFWDRNKTFKPAKDAGKGREKTHKTLQATMRATLGGGELKNAVKLPEGEDLNEWIAVNTVHFYNAANMIYGTCSEFCSDKDCPSMSAGKNEYLWKDDKTYKKPTKVSAPVYIDLMLNWISDRISDPKLFPVDEGAKFPRNFISEVKQVYKRLFRLYAHIYYAHFTKMKGIGANAHLNTCFKHFTYFALEFNLIGKADIQPLESFIIKMRTKDGLSTTFT